MSENFQWNIIDKILLFIRADFKKSLNKRPFLKYEIELFTFFKYWLIFGEM